MRKLSMEELVRLDPDQFREASKLPAVFVLDNIRSAHNVGSVFRSADVFRLEELLLCGITATPPNRDIRKTALGAEAHVAWRHFEHALEAVAALKQEGYRIWAVEQTEASVPLDRFEADRQGKHAFVFGHEVRGVDQELLGACDAAIEIPQYGTKHSLNVSVCAGIVAWEAMRRLGPPR